MEIILVYFTFNSLLLQREFGSQKFKVKREATAIVLNRVM